MRRRGGGWAWVLVGIAGIAAAQTQSPRAAIGPSGQRAPAAPQVSSNASRPLAALLDDDGFLAVPAGFSGAIDPRGFELVSKAGERPRFAAKNAVDEAARWDDQFGIAIGCDARVNAIVAAADGTFYLGGDFTICGNVAVNRVARWDPQLNVFTPLGSGAANGVNGGVNAIAVAVAGNDIYVGGAFTQAGGQAATRVARYNTSSGWSALGSGVNSTVVALAELNGDVYVGGVLTQAGGQPASCVARYSGGQWSPMGGGVYETNFETCAVNALAAFVDEIYVGGLFNQAGGQGANSIARYTPSNGQWSPLGTGVTGAPGASTVSALLVAPNGLHVGGQFAAAGGQAASNVARFSNGQWFPLGAGVTSASFGSVSALALLGADVYAGGSFTQAGGQTANNVARFSGSQWSALVDGVSNENGVNGPVRALAASSTAVYAGGQFAQVGVGQVDVRFVNFVAHFNPAGPQWTPLSSGSNNGVNGPVYAVAVSGNDIYVGGQFTQAGGRIANNVARFNESEAGGPWFPLGTGAANGVGGSVLALAVLNNDLYVGGNFFQAGGLQALCIARYSGGNWHQVAVGVYSTTDDVCWVNALATSSGFVYAGGFFDSAGFTTPNAIAANNVARYQAPNGPWFRLGPSPTVNGVTGEVLALAVSASGDDVYVGGNFYLAAGLATSRVASYRNSNGQWSALGSGGLNGVNGAGFVSVLAVSGSDVYVGGDFAQVGGVPATRVARFNPSEAGGPWFPLGSGPANGVSDVVSALTVSGGDVFVGGSFTQAGDQNINRAARFNALQPGGPWFALSGGTADGTNGTVRALGKSGADLILGGLFNQAGGQFSFRVARYDARRAVTTTASTNPSPSATVTTPVTLFASVATSGFPPALPAPGPGTVDFLDSGNPIPGCTGQALAGTDNTRTSSCVVSTLSLGPHSVVARYSGDTRNIVGTSDPVSLTVDLRLSSTALASSVHPSTFGQPVTFTASVTGLNPSGSVGFRSDGALIPGCSSVPLTGAGDIRTAECATATLAVGTRVITGAYSGDAVHAPSAGTLSPDQLVNPAQPGDLPPNLGFVPEPQTEVPLNPTGASTIGSAASANIPVTATGATGAGSASLSCNVLDPGFGSPTVTGSPFSVSSTSGQIQLSCTIAAMQRSGTLTCQVQPSAGAPLNRSWPVTCPAAGDQAPVLTYAPAPGTEIRFPDGATSAQVQASIGVSDQGAVGNGTTSISSCGVAGGQASAFPFLSGHQTVTTTQSAVPLQLRCVIGQQQRQTTLTCTETSTPGSAAQRQWPLTCPAASSGRVTVGRRIGVPGGRVVIPISFARDALTQTNRFSAQIQFATNLMTTPLSVISVSGANGARCERLSGSDANQIALDWGAIGGPLAPTTDTRYCEATFQIAATATLGPIGMPVIGSTCTDVGGTSSSCGAETGRVTISAMDAATPFNTVIVIAGREGTAQATTTLELTNRSNTVAQLQSCQIVPPDAALWVQAPSSYPAIMQPNQPIDVILGCMLPLLGQTIASELQCGSSDPVRSLMRWDLSCLTLAAQMPLPAPSIYDAEQRVGEQLGSSIARGISQGTAITVVGAPTGGADFDGRVVLYADLQGQGTGSAIAIAKALQATTASGASRLGHAVAIKADGSAIAVGAPFDDPNPATGVTGPGRVYVYARPAQGWASFDSRTASPLGVLDPPSSPGATPSEFGSALAYTAAGELIVGAPGTLVGIPNVGRVFVFDANRQSRGAVISPNQLQNGRFGSALAIAADQVLIGAPGELGTGTAYRLTLSAQSIGSPTRIVPSTILNADAGFGTAIAANDDLIVVGVPGDDTTAGSDSGSAIVFTNPTNPSQASRLLPQTGNGQAAGQSLALNANQIYVGAPNADEPGRSNVGRVYVYPIEATFAAQENPLGALANLTGAANDQFGAAIAADAIGIVVGVPQADLTLSDGTTTIMNMGRVDAFGSDKLDRVFGDGFED